MRLESYMFTEESFRAVRDRLKPDGVLVVYNYFREPWLVDRLANTAAAAFGQEPRVHVHEARAFLGVLMAGPRLATADRRPGRCPIASRRSASRTRRRRRGCTSAIRRSSRPPMTGRSSTCATATSRGTTSPRWR